MKCPYCEQKTTVRETFLDPKAKNSPADTKRLLLMAQWPGQVVIRRRRCTTEPCCLRYSTIEMSTDDFSVFVENEVQKRLLEQKEAS